MTELGERGRGLRQADISVRCRTVTSVAAVWLAAVSVSFAHELVRAVPVPWARDHIERAFYLEGVPLPGSGVSNTIEMNGQSCIQGQYLLVDISDDLDFGDGPLELRVAWIGDAFLISNPAYQSNDLQHKQVRLESSGLREKTVTIDAHDLKNLFIGRADILFLNREEPFTLCDLEFTHPPRARSHRVEGQLTVRVFDDVTGQSTPARLGIFDEEGRPLRAGENALAVSHYDVPTTVLPAMAGTFWPAPAPSLFYTEGVFRTQLPAGEYTIVAMRGPEYRVFQGALTLEPGAHEEVHVPMKRWIDQAALGWHSGDVHVHIGREREDDARILTWMKAEDLRVASLLQMGNLQRTYFPQYAWGEEGTATDEGYYLVPGQEDPRTGHRGHALGLRLQEPIVDRDSYFLYHQFFQEVHRQGGITGYAHFGAYFGGERGLFLDVPFGDVDFVEILQFGQMITEPWYQMLNLGFRLAPVASSDFPYGGLPGTARSYAYIDGPATPEAWNAALAGGRVFATNGPLLELEVNGQGMGATISLSGEEVVSYRGSARVNPDLGRVDRVELVANGRVFRVFEGSAEEGLSFGGSLRVERSTWMAIRAFGPTRGRRLGESDLMAHSGPVYLIVNGDPTGDPCEAREAARRALRQLERLMEEPIDPGNEWEAFDTSGQIATAWADQKPRLGRRVARARAIYEDRLKNAEAEVDFSLSCWYRTTRKRYRWAAILAVGFGALSPALLLLRRRLRRKARRSSHTP